MSEPGGPYGTQPPYNPPPGYSLPPGYSPPPGYSLPPGYSPPPGYGAPTPGAPAAGQWAAPASVQPGYPPPTSPPAHSYEYGYGEAQPQWVAPPAPAPAKKANLWLLGITLVVLLIEVIASFARGAAEEPDDAAYIVGYTLAGPLVAALVALPACLFARPRRITNLALGLALAVLALMLLGSVTPDAGS